MPKKGKKSGRLLNDLTVSNHTIIDRPLEYFTTIKLRNSFALIFSKSYKRHFEIICIDKERRSFLVSKSKHSSILKKAGKRENFRMIRPN